MSSGLAAEAGRFATRFVLDEADEDNILNFEHSSDDGFEEERLRQQAELVPLRSKDHVDHLDKVITRWMVLETEKSLQENPNTIAPSQRSESDHSASLSDAPTSVPQVIVDFLVDKLAPPAQTSPASRAWQLLHNYLSHKNPPTGEAVKTSLDELEVGNEWHDLRIRIMQVEPDDDEASGILLAELEKMKPAEEEAEAETYPDTNGTLDPNVPLDPLLTDVEYDPSPEERIEQEGLTALIAEAAMMEECEVFYVRCQPGTESSIVKHIQHDCRKRNAPLGLQGAFPSMLPGGVYIRITSMLQMHTRASSYFRTIYGFKYPRKPVVSYRSNTLVPLASNDVHLLMPINCRVVDASELAEQRRLRNLPKPRTWIMAIKGRYRGDVGVVLDIEYTTGVEFDRLNEVVVGFLPWLVPGTRPRKKAKVSHPSPEVLQSEQTHPLGPVSPIKGKRRAGLTRKAKVYQGADSILSFARRNSISVSKKPKCYQCERPKTCDHLSKVHIMSGQAITISGIALVVLNHADVQEATTIPAKDLGQWFKCIPALISTLWPLPSSWFFEYGERVQLTLHYGPLALDAEIDNDMATSDAEGWIEHVCATGCNIAFIDQANGVSSEEYLTASTVRFVPFRFIVKVMELGSRVQVRQGSSAPSEGLVVGVGDVIAVKFDGNDDLTHSYHANSLKNLSLMPKVHRDHESILPRNQMPTINKPPTSHTTDDTSTGSIRWVNTEIKVVGGEIDSHIPQMHKGTLGRVVDVIKSSSMKSGLGILVRFNAPSTSPDTLIDFDRIRRCDNGCFLAYNVDASSYFQFRHGYTPTHSSKENYPDIGRTNAQEQEHLNAASNKQSDEEMQRKAASEREAIASHGNQLENAVFTQGGAPLSLRAATLTPSTNWIDDPDITKALPRGKVMVALRDIDHDVEVVISVQDGINKAVYWVKPKGQAPIETLITAQHLDPLRCGHTAEKSFSSKLYLVCSGKHAGRLGRAVTWGVADDIILKPVKHEAQTTGKKYKVRHFSEKPVDGPLLYVSKSICAHVPMMPDEDREARTATPITQLEHILDKKLLGLPITDEERAALGE